MKITENSQSKEYTFEDVKRLSDGKSQGITKLGFPNQEPEEGQVLRFAPASREIRFDFKMRSEDSDVSNGDNIKTPIEQKNYLLDTIFIADIDASWTLNDSTHYPSGKPVLIKEIGTNVESEDPLRYSGNITMIVGNNLGA